MSIRLRLVLSYIAMLFVPLVLSGLAVVVISFIFISHVTSLFHIDLRDGNPFKIISAKESQIFFEMQEITRSQPEQLLDAATIGQLEKRLNELNMGLIIRKGQSIEYASSFLDASKDLQSLPGYGEREQRRDVTMEPGGDSLWIAEKHDFRYSDKSEGTFFLIVNWAVLQKYGVGYAKTILITFIAILVLTNGLLTYYVSRGIIRPIKELQRATVEIKEGNLNFEVVAQSDDEIGQLSTAFEEMRRKLKQSVETQLQYEENRKELISNISHDLKTPVTAIKGYVEGIMDGVTNSPDKLERYIKTIYTKAVDMDRLIDELFLFSKLDLGKLPFQFEQVDLVRYMQDCAQELQFDMEKQGIAFVLADLPEQPLRVTADREKLKRVLMNIIENAVKYRREADSSIRIGVVEIEDKAVIRIEDNGQGIPAEALPHIFDRFYRADPSRSTSTGGSGLGLAIAKQIVEEHGGLVWAASKVGQGTAVYVALPLEPERLEKEEEA